MKTHEVVVLIELDRNTSSRPASSDAADPSRVGSEIVLTENSAAALSGRSFPTKRFSAQLAESTSKMFEFVQKQNPERIAEGDPSKCKSCFGAAFSLCMNYGRNIFEVTVENRRIMLEEVGPGMAVDVSGPIIL